MGVGKDRPLGSAVPCVLAYALDSLVRVSRRVERNHSFRTAVGRSLSDVKSCAVYATVPDNEPTRKLGRSLADMTDRPSPRSSRYKYACSPGASHGIRSLTEPGFQTLLSLSFQSSLQGSLTVLVCYR